METGTAISPISAGTNHLALIAGLPSAITYLVADLCRDLLVRQHGACEVINLNELGEDTITAISAAAGPVLFLAEVPDAAVVEMARGAEFPIAIVDQNFAKACYDFMSARDASLLDTARTMARAQMGLQALADIPRAVLIGVDDCEAASGAAERSAAVLALGADVWQPMVEFRNLARPLPEVLDEIFAYDKAPPDDEADELLDKLARFYRLDPDRRPAAWEVPIGVLLEAAPPHLPANNTLELVGPARCLTLGPYLYLPAGKWSLRFAFSSLENVSTNTLLFDLTADEEVKFSQTYLMKTAGKYEFTSDFEISNAFYPFEFRTFLAQGAIEGKFSLLSLVLERN